MKRLCVGLLLFLAATLSACQPKPVPPLVKECPTAPASLPRDLYTHDWAGTEWWYYTGHLKDDAGKTYGFELTFFRFRGDPEKIKSPLAKGLVGYMAHLSVTEEDAVRYRSDMLAGVEGRLAGAAPDRYRVFVGIDLMVEPDKGYVFHGEGGVVHKGGGLGNYYISNPRMKASGTLTLDGRSVPVSGMAWFDREFGYMGMTPVNGWDWFSLQLDDRTEYMIYRIRRDENGYVPESKACRIDADGHEECVAMCDCDFEVLSRWKSVKTGGVYPASWHIKIPKFGLDATIIPTVPEQEFSAGLPYWEGSCTVLGQPANGKAYIELVGYARPPMAK